jgi:hypothetical protein
MTHFEKNSPSTALWECCFPCLFCARPQLNFSVSRLQLFAVAYAPSLPELVSALRARMVVVCGCCRKQVKSRVEEYGHVEMTTVFLCWQGEFDASDNPPASSS